MIGFFANDVPRLKELWLKKAEQNGGGSRGFIIAFAKDIDKRGTSFTAEEATEVQMAQILEAGLSDLSPSPASWKCPRRTRSPTKCASTPRRTPRSRTNTSG